MSAYPPTTATVTATIVLSYSCPPHQRLNSSVAILIRAETRSLETIGKGGLKRCTDSAPTTHYVSGSHPFWRAIQDMTLVQGRSVYLFSQANSSYNPYRRSAPCWRAPVSSWRSWSTGGFKRNWTILAIFVVRIASCRAIALTNNVSVSRLTNFVVAVHCTVLHAPWPDNPNQCRLGR